MASDFASQFTKELDHSAIDRLSPPNQRLHALLVLLDSKQGRLSPEDVLRAVDELQADELVPASSEWREAILSKLVVSVYADALEIKLRQASEAEAEAQWWARVERSRLNTAWYLLQTLPLRIAHVAQDACEVLRSPQKGLPSPSFLLSAFSPEHPLPIWAPNILLLPIQLARLECTHKRTQLERIRDDCARSLGHLALMRPHLSTHAPFLLSLATIVDRTSTSAFTAAAPTPSTLPLIAHLARTALPSLSHAHTTLLRDNALLRPAPLTLAWPKLVLYPALAFYSLSFCYTRRADAAQIVADARDTLRAFIQDWLVEPLKDVLRTVRGGPPDSELAGVIVSREGVLADINSLERMTLSLARDVLHYDESSLAALGQQVRQGVLTQDIMRIYEEDMRSPIKSAVAGTLVRGILLQVQKAKVDIDQALTGIDRLLKSQELTFAFVGVAPALVITYALTGLLRTTVRRILGTVTLRGKAGFGSAQVRGECWSDMRRVERILLRQGPHRHSGSSARIGVSSTPRSSNSGSNSPSPSPPPPPPTGTTTPDDDEPPLPALPTGLLLLSLARLRAYASAYLPASAHAPALTLAGARTQHTHGYPAVGGMRAAFLEDLADLEDPQLGRRAKMRVVDRMWRCWGGVLGWY